MSSLKINIKLPHSIQRLPLEAKVIISVTAFLLISYIVLFVVPQPVLYSYTKTECVQRVTLFPGLMQPSKSSRFSVSFRDGFSIGNLSVMSTKTCFTATATPTIGLNTVGVSPFGWLFAASQYAVKVARPPVARTTDLIGKILPLTRPVEITLDKVDQVFTYSLAVGNKKAGCNVTGATLRCPLETLELEQGKQYQVSLDRYFDTTKVATLAAGQITTLNALILQKVSVADGQIVYDVPASFTFDYDKDLSDATATLQQRSGQSLAVIASTVSVAGRRITVTPQAPLQRNTVFELTILKAQSVEGSSVSGQYKVTFTMSGGPKVTAISVGTISAPLSATIIVTFDQEISNTNQMTSLVTINGLSAVVVKSGSTLRISYATAPVCSNYTIAIKKGLVNAAGIVQQDDWNFSGRTQCYTLRTIGYSAKNRPITAYMFGSGSRTILYTGAMHGNEVSGKLLLNAWVNELEANPQNIPAGVRIVIVPAVNPDGVAANVRLNGNNVDLNRNFKVSDWTSDIQNIYGQPFIGGGGSAPESEPETKALAAFTRELLPALTMSYHAAAGYAIANTCGNSASLAASYSSLVNYRNMTGVSGAFGYEITGTYDDWICESLGLPSVLVELTTNTNSEFSRQKAALWAMATSL